VYEIIKIRTITSKEAKHLDPTDPDGKYLRIAFDLKLNRSLYNNFQKLDFAKYPIQLKTFIDTTFEEQNQWVAMNNLDIT
jgi:hypothetical protein